MPIILQQERLTITFRHTKGILMKISHRSINYHCFSEHVQTDTHWRPTCSGIPKATNNLGMSWRLTVLKYFVNQ